MIFNCQLSASYHPLVMKSLPYPMTSTEGQLARMKDKVFFDAKNNMSVDLVENLMSLHKSNQLEVLNNIVEEAGQKCTPLLIAARNGCSRAIRVLLTYEPDLEQEGTVKFNGYVIEGASPLWCAAGAGHLEAVELLVAHGADVNHATKTSSAPLRAACFDGRLDIVKYLTDRGADIHITNKYNNTCLMIAAYKGHLEIVKFLLNLGARIDERAHCGATASHFAAECGHLNIVKELIEYKATIFKNEHGITPLIAAAEWNKADVVDYFISETDVSKEEKIDALELLGASFASDKDNYNIELAFKYLMQGMQERFRDQDDVINKPRSVPIPAYENRVECGTIEELEAIRNNSSELHMESLTIRERILKSNNPEVPHAVIFRGAVFADNSRFDRCLQLWTHALRLKQDKVSIVKDLLRFAQVFSQMLHVFIDLEFVVVEEVLKATQREIERNCYKIQFPGPKDDIDIIKEELESNMVTALYLIMIVIKVIDKMTKEDAKESEKKIKHTIYRLVRVGARTRLGQSLLHLSVSPDTPVDDFHTNHVCRFPCAKTTKFLIACGANVNEMDLNRNTPLHLIVPYQNPVSDFLTLHTIIMALIESGAHMDTVNESGATPIEAATTGVAELILRTQSKLSLKCIASRAVKKYNIGYKGHVPKHLETFVELHGTCHVNSLASEIRNSVRNFHL